MFRSTWRTAATLAKGARSELGVFDFSVTSDGPARRACGLSGPTRHAGLAEWRMHAP
jgi:hypothetical protein